MSYKYLKLLDNFCDELMKWKPHKNREKHEKWIYGISNFNFKH